MVYRLAQLVLPWVQTMYDLASEIGHPPHTTSLPPDWRERLWWDRGLGNSGTEHVSEEGGGKISTDESRSSLLSQPPTTSCPDAKIVKERNGKQKYEESFCSFVSLLLLWHWLSVENIDRKTRAAARMIITKAQLVSVRCFVINFLRADVFLIGLQLPEKRLKNPKLCGWQNITSNNFPDRARKLFLRRECVTNACIALRHKCAKSACHVGSLISTTDGLRWTGGLLCVLNPSRLCLFKLICEVPKHSPKINAHTSDIKKHENFFIDENVDHYEVSGNSLASVSCIGFPAANQTLCKFLDNK